jgi:NAD(P)-dependent dehydrogenase (short-subunit alcohol dehydrogenase family)
MSWSTSDIPSLAGRTAVVTGANGGLGLETARALAGAGAHVVVAARDQAKAARALEAIRTNDPGADVALVELNLASLASVRAAAEQIASEHSAIDILVNNAGVMGIPEQQTEDGFEMQLGVNHLGHFALTAHLLPALLAAPAARVVSVTSIARHTGLPADPKNPHLHGRYRPWRSYNRSKLANYHFAIGLQRRLAAAGAPAISLMAHPGLSNTNLQAHSVEATGGGFSQRFWYAAARHTGMTAAAGALPQLRAATDPRARGGELYAPRFMSAGAPVRRPVLRRVGLTRSIDRLWELSERETGVTLLASADHL